MQLKELKDIIHSDLTLIKDYMKLEDVCCYSNEFKLYENCEVIGIRAKDDYVIVSIK